jgi:hypothetical protein
MLTASMWGSCVKPFLVARQLNCQHNPPGICLILMFQKNMFDEVCGWVVFIGRWVHAYTHFLPTSIRADSHWPDTI